MVQGRSFVWFSCVSFWNVHIYLLHMQHMHLKYILDVTPWYFCIYIPPQKKNKLRHSQSNSSPSHKTPKKISSKKSPTKLGNRKIGQSSPPQPTCQARRPYPRGGCRLSTGGDCTCGPKSTSADRSARGAARQARDEGDGACGDAWGEVWNGWTGGVELLTPLALTIRKGGGLYTIKCFFFNFTIARYLFAAIFVWIK